MHSFQISRDHTFINVSKLSKFEFSEPFRFRKRDLTFRIQIEKHRSESSNKNLVDVKMLGVYVVLHGDSQRASDLCATIELIVTSPDRQAFKRIIEHYKFQHNNKAGFHNFLPISIMNKFLHNDSLFVTARITFVNSNQIDRHITDSHKEIYFRIYDMSKLLNTGAKVQSLAFDFKGLKWQMEAESALGQKSKFYNIYLEAISPAQGTEWKLKDVEIFMVLETLARKDGSRPFYRRCNLNFSSKHSKFMIGGFKEDEIYDERCGFIMNDTISIKVALRTNANNLQFYDDAIHGVQSVALCYELEPNDPRLCPELKINFTVHDITQFNKPQYTEFSFARNFCWGVIAKPETICISDQLNATTLGIYLQCINPSSNPNWFCNAFVEITLKSTFKFSWWTRSFNHTFSAKESVYGYKNFLLMDEVLAKNNKFVNRKGNVCLTIRVIANESHEIELQSAIVDIEPKSNVQGTISKQAQRSKIIESVTYVETVDNDSDKNSRGNITPTSDGHTSPSNETTATEDEKVPELNRTFDNNGNYIELTNNDEDDADCRDENAEDSPESRILDQETCTSLSPITEAPEEDFNEESDIKLLIDDDSDEAESFNTATQPSTAVSPDFYKFSIFMDEFEREESMSSPESSESVPVNVSTPVKEETAFNSDDSDTTIIVASGKDSSIYDSMMSEDDFWDAEAETPIKIKTNDYGIYGFRESNQQEEQELKVCNTTYTENTICCIIPEVTYSVTTEGIIDVWEPQIAHSRDTLENITVPNEAYEHDEAEGGLTMECAFDEEVSASTEIDQNESEPLEERNGADDTTSDDFKEAESPSVFDNAFLESNSVTSDLIAKSGVHESDEPKTKDQQQNEEIIVVAPKKKTKSVDSGAVVTNNEIETEKKDVNLSSDSGIGTKEN